MKNLPIGVFDDPKNQRQALYELNLQKSNVVVFGSAMSGKTTFIKNLLIKMHENYTPDIENVYVIDFSGGLLKYRELDLISACFDNTNEENVKRLFNRLETVFKNNTKILAGKNFIEYNEENKPSHTTFIIENLNGFLADKRYESYQEKLLKLCREGLSKGITVVFTATETAGGINQFVNGFGQKVVFEMPSDKLYDIFGGKVNAPMAIQGRGLLNVGNQIYEFQGFLPFMSGEDEIDQYINKDVKQAPKLVSFDGDLSNDNFNEYSHKKESVIEIQDKSNMVLPAVMGLDYYEMKPLVLDLHKIPSIGIYGKRQSGKTNLLWLIVERAIHMKSRKGLRFVLFDDGRKQLESFTKFFEQNDIDYKLITQIGDMKDYLYNNDYYDAYEPDGSNNPFTVFIMQNKSLYTTKEEDLLLKIIPVMLSEADEKWMFVFSDVKVISDSSMRNAFNDSLAIAFLFDNIGEFVSDRGSKTIFGSMEPKELKEQFARIERGDGYFYDIDSDELLKLKVLYSEQFKVCESEEGIECE